MRASRDKYVPDPYEEYLAGKSKSIVTVKPGKPIDLARLRIDEVIGGV
jgi:hypothetical protein